LITKAAARSTDDAQKLRDAGWSEDQIAEAVYVTALFAFFNRVADAFAELPGDGEAAAVGRGAAACSAVSFRT
jgi:alkylhydroperoxidase family enzyme